MENPACSTLKLGVQALRRIDEYQPFSGPSAASTALEECRRQAQKCIDESTRVQSPSLRADWLALAEQWIRTAQRGASHTARDQRSSWIPSTHSAGLRAITGTSAVLSVTGG